jgi:glycosyltransferase involved in cell wall biosynthesis
MKRLSLLMIAKNAEELLDKSLESTEGLVDEIIIVDNGSIDKTVEISKKYKAHIYTNSDKDLGKLREYGFEKTTGDWVLMLDADEVLSQELKNEIASFKRSPEAVTKHTGYVIPYTNHFLGRPLKYGGENYKILRLFKRDMVKIDSALLHEKFEVTQGTVGELNHPIYHYSYRSLAQVYKKFTDYALRDARQRKQKGEKTSLKKIFLYPIHMFWARYIEDKGYKDGLFRILLDLGFAYMEWLTYFYMALHTYYKKYALISILFIFLFKNLFIIFSIPPWEAPDEPGHVSYVIYMYNNKSFPSATQPFVLQSINESFKKK